MNSVTSLIPLAIPIIAIICGSVIAIAAIITIQWRKTRTAAYEARLKQIMIERGMSASEIDMILRATSLDDDDDD